MSETPAETSMSLSVVVQMKPIWRPDRPGVAWRGDLQEYAEQMTRYLQSQLVRFCEPRGADLFLAVVAQRGGETAGHEFRDGDYVKMVATEAESPFPPQPHPGHEHGEQQARDEDTQHETGP